MYQIQKVFKQSDGNNVIITNIANYNIFRNQYEFNVFAKVNNKYYYPGPYEKTLNGLFVDEYIKHGRKGLLSVVRPHELIKTRLELEKLL